MKLQIVDDLKFFHRENPLLVRALLLFSLFSSAAILAPFFNFLLDVKPEIKDFSNHIISNGTVNDFDVASRVSLYYKGFLVLLSTTVLLFLFLYKWLKNAVLSANASASLEFIITLSAIGIVCTAAGIFQVRIDIAVIVILLLCVYLLSNIKTGKKYWDYHMVLWLLFVSFPFSVIAAQFVFKRNPGLFTKKIEFFEIVVTQSYTEIIYLGLLLLCTLVVLFFLNIIFKKTDTSENTEIKKAALLHSAKYIMLILPLSSLAFEILNILNVRAGIVVNKPFAIILVIAFAAVATSYSIYRKKLKSKPYNAVSVNVFSRYYYPLMLINVVLMTVQPWKVLQPENEFFEFANHGLSVDHFFRYGMLPIVETFDAHMLSNQIFAYLYGFLNGYEPWAPFLYTWYINALELLVAYYLLKKFTGSTKALLVCLFLPFPDVIINFLVLSGLPVLALLRVIQFPSLKNHCMLWGSALALCLFRLDLGFAAISAVTGAYFIVNYATGRRLDVKKLFISGAIVFGAALVLFALLCAANGVNPISRLSEFLTVAMSNQNWTYEAMGDKSNIAFRLFYYILPLLLFILLMYILVKVVFNEGLKLAIVSSQRRFAAFTCFIFFSIAFFANAPRGIVRHSFLFDNLNMIAGTILLAFLSYIYIKHRKYNFILFLVVSLSFFITLHLKKQSVKDVYRSNLYSGVFSGPFAQQFYDAANFNGTRCAPTFSMAEVNLFKDILNKVLKPDETYFDFSSNNYYYALTGRKNPLYINQSPLLLNGDASQELALKHIKDNPIPLVLMPAKDNIWRFIDGIPVDFKYYILSEYIYQNYDLLMELTTCDVYVLKAKKAAYEKILKQGGLVDGGQIITGFSGIAINSIPKNGINLEQQGNKLTLMQAGNDPFIYGLLDLLKVRGRLNENLPVSITIKIEPETTGNVQIFYLMPNVAEYSEEASKTFIMGQNVTELTIDIPALPKDLRIDIDTPRLTINEIRFKNPEGLDAPAPVVQAVPVPDYGLGSIPRVWAEKSGTSLFKKVKNLNRVAEGNSAIKEINNKNKKAGYLYIEMECDTMHGATVGLLAGSVKKVGYSLTTKKGRHEYAIRLSSNNSWWKADITKLTFSSEHSVKIYKFAYISEDGSEVQSGIDDYLTLSNVSDQNWYGGVGLLYNVFLMDNSTQNQTLKAGQKIQFADGRLATIKDVRQTGNFLHIEIVENVIDYKDIAAFPNTLKLVK